jgi:hypothetical protein
MSKMLLVLYSLVTPLVWSQTPLLSGNYDSELIIAYNSSIKKVTGYYENATGENDQFSCIFYLEGQVKGNTVLVQTYFPNDKANDLQNGTLNIVSPKGFSLQIAEDHGGCWNVQHFSDNPVSFELQKETKWIQINYVIANKSFMYYDSMGKKRMKSYLVKNDIVCVNRIENDRAYCEYSGAKIIKGWVPLRNLNPL